MRFTAASLLAFASAVLAQTAGFDVISKPTEDSVVPAGKTYTITWAPSTEYNNDTITLTLLGGATPQTLQTVSIIKAGVANSAGKFEWKVSSSLGSDATYGIEITLDSDPSILEYSFPFTISGGSSSSASGSASATHSTAVSSAASSAASTSSTEPTSSSSSTKTTTKATITPSSASSSAPTTLSTQTFTGVSNTTVATGHKTVTTSTQTATKTGSSATGTVSTVPTSGAKAVGTGSFLTLVGGLAVAFFAL